MPFSEKSKFSGKTQNDPKNKNFQYSTILYIYSMLEDFCGFEEKTEKFC